MYMFFFAYDITFNAIPSDLSIVSSGLCPGEYYLYLQEKNAESKLWCLSIVELGIPSDICCTNCVAFTTTLI